MTLSALEALVLEEIRHAHVRQRHRLVRCPIGTFVTFWTNHERAIGFGGRVTIYRRSGLRRRAHRLAVLTAHRCPKIDVDLPVADIEGRLVSKRLFPPLRMSAERLGPVIAWAIALGAPTARRLREAGRRLCKAGIRARDYEEQPSRGPRRAA